MEGKGTLNKTPEEFDDPEQGEGGSSEQDVSLKQSVQSFVYRTGAFKRKLSSFGTFTAVTGDAKRLILKTFQKGFMLF